ILTLALRITMKLSDPSGNAKIGSLPILFLQLPKSFLFTPLQPCWASHDISLSLAAPNSSSDATRAPS
ncbi:hypothetical protein Tco_0250183, partial [Tanacetum coccineum]